MKRAILILLTLCVLLGGCDLRNRQPSSDFIATGQAAEPTSAPVEQTQPTTGKPPVAQGAAVVKKVYAVKGNYVDLYETVWNYDYQIPFVDLASADVNQINAEIERNYRAAVREQEALMAVQEPLTVPFIGYEVFTNGDVLTLLLHRKTANNTQSYSVYNFSCSTGKGVGGEELIAQVGMTTEAFLEQVEEALSSEFIRRFGEYEQSDSLFYALQYQKTLSPDNVGVGMPMYLDESGTLNVIATLYCVGLVQGTDLYILRLSGQPGE